MSIIRKYFPNLEDEKLDKLEALQTHYLDWNTRINLISRKDTSNFPERHVLHSLAIAKQFSFEPGCKIADFGSGGGFPGIPLAIMFPDCKFYLIDSVSKKIKAVEDICNKVGLKNVLCIAERVERINDKFDIITGRAVTALPKFMLWCKNKIKDRQINSFANGIIYLKGGDFEEELKLIPQKTKVYFISNFFEEPFFETKKIVHIYD